MSIVTADDARLSRYNPLDPVAFGSNAPCPNVGGTPVLSAVVGDNAALFTQVARLWIAPGDDVLDATYGRGAFWRNLPGLPTHRFDALTGHDLRALPVADASVDVFVLDPPYRPTHGSKTFTSNGLAQAYQLGEESLDTINDVLNLYRGGITEAWRTLRPGGRVMVKCQDLSFGHRLHMATLDVLRELIGMGFDMADQFILANASQLASPTWVEQERARRAHSVLWVAVKPGSPPRRTSTSRPAPIPAPEVLF